MDFDPSTAKEVGWEYSFDPSTAKLDEPFDPKTATPLHDWGTTDARDSGKINPGMSAPERKGTIGERIIKSGSEAVAVSPLGRATFSGLPEANLAKEQKKWLQNGEFGKPGTPGYEEASKFIAGKESEAAKKIANYIETRLNLSKDIEESNPHALERIVGGIGGSLFDPTNALPLPTKWYKMMAAAGGLGAATSYNQATFDRELGLLKDDPTIAQLLESGVDTAVIAMALNIVGRGIGRAIKGKTQTPPASPVDGTIEALKKQEQGVGIPKLPEEPSKAPTAAPEAIVDPLPEILPDFKPVETLDAQQARMDAEVRDIPRPDAEAVPKLDLGEVPADPAVKVAAQAYPELDVQMPKEGNQYMTGKAIDIASAENMAGTEALHTNRDIANATITNEIVPNFSRANSGLDSGPIIPKLASDLHKAKTVGESLEAIKPYLTGDNQKVWEAINRSVRKDIPFEARTWDDNPKWRTVDKLDESRGVHTLTKEGVQQVAIRGASYELQGNKPHGVNVEVPLHEAAHAATEPAYQIAATPALASKSEYQAHVRYVRDMNALWKAVYDAVQKQSPIKLSDERQALWDHTFTRENDSAEFNSYGWTNPEFRKWLSEIKVGPYGRNAWEKFKEAVKQFFGGDKSALTAIDRFLDRLDEIQGIPKEELKIAVNSGQVFDRFAKDVSEIKDGNELMNYIRGQNVGDLGYAIVKHTPVLKEAFDFINRNLTTTNQTARIFRHPVLLWVAQHIPTIQRQAELRIQKYKEHLASTIKLTRGEQLEMFKKLVDINRPELLEARKQAEATNTREQLLRQEGMPPALIPEAIKVLDVMKDLYLNEQISAGRLNRGFPEAPMYFPRSHGGTFKFRVIDPSKPPDAQLIYIKGFTNAVEAQRWQTEMAAKLKGNPNGWEVSPVERVDVPGFMDSLGDMILEESLPEFLRNQVRDISDKMLVSKRKFELERAARNIGGYIGEQVDMGDSIFSMMRPENNRLLDLLNNRIDDSYRFEVQSRIITEIIDPILSDTASAVQRPRLHRALQHIVMREMGYDVSAKYTLGMDNWIQAQADSISKAINKSIGGKLLGYEPSDISMLTPNGIKKMVQRSVWFTSAWKLGWNLPVIATNSTAIPLVGFDGIRTAAKEGVNPLIPAAAYQKMFLAPWDAGAKNFMKQAELEGMISARAADLFTITETHGVQGMVKVADTLLNYGRNKVEEATNYTSILYYYNYYKLAEPHLNELSNAFKTKVYSAARSWTGDYRSLATPQAVSKLGLTGRATSNFSKWMYNQTGRLLDDMAEIRENPTKMQAYMPLLANVGTMILVGGLLGMTGIAEYEMLRNLGQKLGAWDWRPASAWITEAQEAGKKLTGINPIPDWMKRGLLTEASDAAVKQLTGGEESGPDISGSLRHAPLITANLVVFSTFWDIVANGGGAAIKKAMELAKQGPGLSQQDEKNIAKALPTFMAPILKDEFKEQRIVNGKKQYITQGANAEEGDYAQSEYERKLELLGFKTKKQNTASDLRQYQLWLERTRKDKTSQLINAILNPRNLKDKELTARNVNELYSIGGDTALNNLVNQLSGRPIKRMTTYDERLVLEYINSADPMSRKEAAETIRRYRELKSRSTSSGR